MWIPKGFVGADALRARLAAIHLSRDGVVPFDPSCPSMRETLGGVTGEIYAAQVGLVVATDGSVRKDGGMGAGACWSTPKIAPVSVTVHGPVKSIVPELTGLAVAAEGSPLDQDLTVLTDSKASLQLLRGMQREDFPCYCHGRTELPLLERVIRALNRRVEAGSHTRLVKVKAHAGEPLNSWADHLATSAAEGVPTDTELDPLAVYLYVQNRPVVWSPRLKKVLIDACASRAYESFTRSRVSLDRSPEAGAPAPRSMNRCETFLSRVGVGRSLLWAAM